MTKQSHNGAGAPIKACDDEKSCEVVSCEVCLAEVPGDLATSFDGQDYVHHFCGLDCLARWHKGSHPPKS